MACKRAAVPHAPITPIEEVAELEFVKSSALRTRTPDGRLIRLPPPAVGVPALEEAGRELPFAPAYGENTDSVLTEAGLSGDEIAKLRSTGVVA